jgi:hypothetical protein
MKASRSATLAVRAAACLGALASCGGDPGQSPATTGDPLATDGVSSNRKLPSGKMKKDTGLPPLFFTQFVDPAPGPVSVHAAAVDARGNTFVLGHDVRDEDFVYRFDPQGAFASKTMASAAEFLDESVLRANDTGFVVAGTQGGAAGPRIHVDRFGAQRLFEYSGAQGTTAGGADLCGDGTTLVAQATTAGDAAVIALDASGAAKWTTALDDLRPTDVRCARDRSVRVIGVSRASAPVVAQLGVDGSVDWRFSSADAVTTPSLAIDERGDAYVAATRATEGATQYLVIALSPRGDENWRFASDGPSDSLQGIAANEAIAVTGLRGSNLFTVELDRHGRVLWTRVDAAGGAPSAQAVALDAANEAFVCGSTGVAADAFLYGPRTGTLAFETPLLRGIFADVTGGIARCVGTSGDGIGILAFRVR